jgi:amino acid adenylation domain-containing protein
MNKCLEVAVSLYGIMKAGAAYVPLDPSAPPARTADIIDDCDIKILLSANNRKRVLPQLCEGVDESLIVIGPDALEGCPTVETWASLGERYSAERPDVKILESDLAYIIYTSGSTGLPKGIMHTHHSALSFARWAADEYGLLGSDRLSNHAPLHFDLSIFDYFAAVVAGSCTVIIPEEYTRLPASYSQLLADAGVTVLFTVPFALIQIQLRGILEERNLGALRWVIFGGEPMPIKYLCALMQQLPGARFDNMYGPAEVNGCTHFTVVALQPSDSAISIGRICQIAEALIIDGSGAPVAEGDVGELLVRTPTMMQGYWRRPELNRAAFHAITEKEIRKVFYKTGDLVARDADGLLWFRGRKDRQVKVRGYRVELDEIESVLVAHQQVEEAAVFAVKGEEAQFEIRAAVRAGASEGLEPAACMDYLRQHLPAYALPAELVVRDAFPRTTSGKIDRRALSLEAAA